MGADGEEFHHRRLVERKVGGGEEVAQRHGEIFGHAAVQMHAEHADASAAIGETAAAGAAGSPQLR